MNKLDEVMECVFLCNALEDAQNEDNVVATAEECGCCGECTLEKGCVLYKKKNELSGEDAFFEKLKSEFLYHMLGE